MSEGSSSSSNSQTNKKGTQIVPTGLLRRLSTSEIAPSTNNPRLLFDKEPLQELKKNIREHGVLVPITVYKERGHHKFSILDGERRYKCCVELEEEGLVRDIPANIVDPPTKIAGLLYMFSIHNFREQWELMPTALSLQIVMHELGETDNKALNKLTGLSEPQINRCKLLLEFPEKFQSLSLEPDPTKRIPSNFWIEAKPVLDLAEELLPDLALQIGRDGLTDLLVEKYRAKGVKSVLHFRRIMEAYDLSENENQLAMFTTRLRAYFEEVRLETRTAFDEFVVDNRRIQSALKACDTFLRQLQRSKLDYTSDDISRKELMAGLQAVKDYADQLLQKLSGEDVPPIEIEEEHD